MPFFTDLSHTSPSPPSTPMSTRFQIFTPRKNLSQYLIFICPVLVSIFSGFGQS